jgi:hypothetical protein
MLELAAGRVSRAELVDRFQEQLNVAQGCWERQAPGSGACRYPGAGGVGPRSQAQSSIAW